MSELWCSACHIAMATNQEAPATAALWVGVFRCQTEAEDNAPPQLHKQATTDRYAAGRWAYGMTTLHYQEA